MTIETFPFDVAEYLTDDETIAALLTEVLESEDPTCIAKALGAIARARGGIVELARKTGISEAILRRSLTGADNLELGTAIKVIHALGIRISASLGT